MSIRSIRFYRHGRADALILAVKFKRWQGHLVEVPPSTGDRCIRLSRMGAISKVLLSPVVSVTRGVNLSPSRLIGGVWICATVVSNALEYGILGTLAAPYIGQSQVHHRDSEVLKFSRRVISWMKRSCGQPVTQPSLPSQLHLTTNVRRCPVERYQYKPVGIMASSRTTI